MKTLFGMRILPERKQFTDDEFVSQVREFLAKYDGRRKWLLGIPIVFALATMLLIGWLVHMAVKMAPILRGVQVAPEVWLVLGLATGWLAGHLLTATVHSFIIAVGDTFDMRVKRLLVRYYDACTGDRDAAELLQSPDPGG